MTNGTRRVTDSDSQVEFKNSMNVIARSINNYSCRRSIIYNAFKAAFRRDGDSLTGRQDSRGQTDDRVNTRRRPRHCPIIYMNCRSDRQFI